VLSSISATFVAPTLVMYFMAASACCVPVPLMRNTFGSFWATSSLELAAGISMGTPALSKIGSVGSVAPEQ
jgi:hypothetical protein